MDVREIRLPGEGPQVAARQAAALFALAGLLAVVGIAAAPDRTGTLLAVAAADLCCAAAGWWLPWHRCAPWAPVLLGLPAFTVAGLATWALGGVAAGTGPFFVLMFAWFGLNFPPRVIWLAAPVGLLAYVLPLIATHRPPAALGSATILLPIAVGIGLLIAGQVRGQRRDRERIAQLERWRAALSATLAHDLRSPLAAIQLVLEELRTETDTLPAAQRTALLAAALRQIGRLNRLSAGLLDEDRVDVHGGPRLHLAQVPLRRAVERALAEIEAGDAVVVDVPLSVVVPADPRRLEQIIVNLTTNALRHGRAPVVISGALAGTDVCIEVRDHGPGVSHTARKGLFTRFGGAETDPDSVGLGLWIVRQLTRAHGGDVRYEPARPGTRMIVTLPAARDGLTEADVGIAPTYRSDRANVPFITGTSLTSPTPPTVRP